MEVDSNALSTIQEPRDTSPIDARQTLYKANSNVIDNSSIVFDELPPPPTDEDVYKFMSLQGLQPRRLPTRSDLVYFLHVSKSAGTFFCDCGRKNGKNRGLNPFPNCHYLRQDHPIWGVPEYPIPDKDPHPKGCTKQIAQYRRYGINLEGNENFLPSEGKICPELHSAILIRSPIHRLVSHLVWLLGDNVWSMTPDIIFSQYPMLSDNFYVRSLRGYDRFKQPFGVINHGDLLNAKDILRKFKQVLIVDTDLSRNMLFHFGWSCSGIPGKRSKFQAGTQGVVNSFREHWGEKEFQRLVNQNRFDQELFEEARLLQRASELSR